jgi:hypothetical protein
MSRINRARIVDGDDVTAASLNDRFDDFSQANELDQFNLRDAAVDLPQFKKSPKFQAPFVQVDVLGKADLLHASPVSVSATGTSPYTSPHVVEDGAGTATIANYGASGLTIDSSQVFRVYWSLSVNAPSRRRTGKGCNTTKSSGVAGEPISTYRLRRVVSSRGCNGISPTIRSQTGKKSTVKATSRRSSGRTTGTP